MHVHPLHVDLKAEGAWVGDGVGEEEGGDDDDGGKVVRQSFQEQFESGALVTRRILQSRFIPCCNASACTSLMVHMLLLRHLETEEGLQQSCIWHCVDFLHRVGFTDDA